jgi:14-3-3 protein epsilon
MSDKYEKQVYLAMLAEQCSRFEDMTEFLEEMVKHKIEDLTSDERNLLSIAYKNSISLRRQAVRTLLAYELKEKKREHSLYLPYVQEYKGKIEVELTKLCENIIGNIDTYLIPRAGDDEARVFYHKMKADYYRYIAENVDTAQKEKYGNLSLASYNTATEAASSLLWSNPIRLGLALNFSVFYFEVLEKHEEACKIAKDTLDQAKIEMQNADEDDDMYKDPYSIINLLQENLNMWTVDD